MIKSLKRAYLYLGNDDYGRVEASLNTYVAAFVCGRKMRPNEVSYLSWDLYVFNLITRGEDNVWLAYHVEKAAQYFPSRSFLITDRFTWEFFDVKSPNMILMDQPNWSNILRNQLEIG